MPTSRDKPKNVRCFHQPETKHPEMNCILLKQATSVLGVISNKKATKTQLNLNDFMNIRLQTNKSFLGFACLMLGKKQFFSLTWLFFRAMNPMGPSNP